MRLITTLLIVSTISLNAYTASNAEPPPANLSAPTDKDKKSNEVILKGFKTTKVANHTYVIHGPLEMPTKANHGFMNNPSFVITEKSVVVIDPGSNVQLGRELVKRIKVTTDKPITHVFNTHVHGDHWLANQAIKEAFPKALFYAHPKMIKKANNGEAQHWVGLMEKLTKGSSKGTTPVIPTEALTDKQSIEVDGLHFIAHLSQHAHSLTDAMIELQEDKLLFTGDNITNQRLPRMSDGSFIGNIAAAERGLKLDINVVVPGHGSTGDKKVLENYRDYLDILFKTVTHLKEEEDMEAFEMKAIVKKKLVQFKDWAGFEDQVGKHIADAIAEIENSEF
ncbi:MAG: MBL fold metallo-hydrolase [Thiotrichaceae bacterium]|nr:MBL fold metallo-hydrolase [Thiotrichaceae bacterium]